MAEQTAPENTVVERVAEPLADDQQPQGRVDLAAGAFAQNVLAYLTGQGIATGTPATGPQKMCLVANTMPTGGAAPAATWPATGATGLTITWPAVTAPTGANAATAQATAVNFTGVPAGTYKGYAVYNSSGAYLYSKAFTDIVIPASATGNISVTATHSYTLS